MEGPSLFLAAQQLKPFKSKIILEVNGNTKIGKERLLGQKVLDIFAWGKHLVFQFETFAMRVHFMLYGSFEACVKEKMVTGDYPRKNRPPRLQLLFKNGETIFFSCSLKFIESNDAKSLYDSSIDIMSPDWNADKALMIVKKLSENQIGDVLLDQSIFAGVGNIIKNEVLFMTQTLPTRTIKELSQDKLKEIIQKAQSFSHQFYKWRKRFVLREHYRVYRQSVCPVCQGKINRKKTGQRDRFSFYCTHCQL